MAGCVPAEVAETLLWRFQIATASWLRAESRVHTNTTRSAWCSGDSTIDSSASALTDKYVRRRSPSERMRRTTSAFSRTRTWWATRLDGIDKSDWISDGDASPAIRRSTIANRPGSPRAAWIDARVIVSTVSSVFIDSIVTERVNKVNFVLRFRRSPPSSGSSLVHKDEGARSQEAPRFAAEQQRVLLGGTPRSVALPLTVVAVAHRSP